MSNSKEIKKVQNETNKKNKSIKIGLISQDSSYINANELFNKYFEKSKPNTYMIKDKNRFEFSLLNLPQISISIHNIKKLEDINDKYHIYNFFIIFIDIQNSSSKSFLDKSLDTIIEADDNNFNKKCYIYGFYKNNENEKITEEKITTISEAKGIEYYYNEVTIDDIESFSKLIECTINDCNTIMIEKELAKKHSEIASDNSNSHCIIC